MGHVQLRRYVIEPGALAEFVEFWRGLVPIREQYGYRVLFAYADPVHDQFVWALEHDRPLEEVDPVYAGSPERAAHWQSFPGTVRNSVVSEVEVLLG